MRIFATFIAASVVAAANAAGWVTAPEQGGSMPIFRKEFAVADTAAEYALRCTALGVYEVSVNGARVDMGLLNPGWTDYRREVMMQSADIKPYLAAGLNVIEFQLSRGWWAGEINRGAYGPDTPLCLYASISRDGMPFVETDTTWICSLRGPLLSGDIYDGEAYDATRAPADWLPAATYAGPAPAIIPHQGPLVKERPQRLWRHPDSVTVYRGSVPTGTELGAIHVVGRHGCGKPFKLCKGETAFIDFGQNFAGVVSLKAKGGRGAALTVRHGEMLNSAGDRGGRLDDGPAGSLWTYNLRQADAKLQYVMAGDGWESIRPRHTFMGFRYIEITATDDVEIAEITGIPIGSDIEEWGEFECSDPDINALYGNTWWSQRSNFLSVPTDCPQRDERLGWTGDTQIFSRTALYNSDAADFYRKWMRDMRNSQRADGAYPDIAPWCNFWGFGTAAWGDAGVIVPWNVYEFTGDDTILHENYDSMARWMDYLAAQSETTDSATWTHIGGGTATGDWLAYDPVEERYVSMAYYVYVADLMAKIASTLGRADDAARYAALARDIRLEFAERYVGPDGLPLQSSQTAYLLALRHGLLAAEAEPAAVNALSDKIHANGDRLSTGFVGTPLLCSVLSDYGADGLAYTLLQQRRNPSWLYSIDQGATTIWERWDSYTLEGGFNKHPWNMNSFNHYAYGAVVEWMYAYMCGIRPGAPGFGSIVFAPHADRRTDAQLAASGQKRIEWARASTITPHGRVTAEWRRQPDGAYAYTLTLPAGLPYTIDISGLTEADTVNVCCR